MQWLGRVLSHVLGHDKASVSELPHVISLRNNTRVFVVRYNPDKGIAPFSPEDGIPRLYDEWPKDRPVPRPIPQGMIYCVTEIRPIETGHGQLRIIVHYAAITPQEWIEGKERLAVLRQLRAEEKSTAGEKHG